jgi:hypothetical protein
MKPDQFLASLAALHPPPGLSSALLGLWHDGKGDWDKAHRIVQEAGDRDSAWVHAYLHRKEGDLGNADYWYSQARQPRAGGTLAEEWTTLVDALCAEAEVHNR